MVVFLLASGDQRLRNSFRIHIGQWSLPVPISEWMHTSCGPCVYHLYQQQRINDPYDGMRQIRRSGRPRTMRRIGDVYLGNSATESHFPDTHETRKHTAPLSLMINRYSVAVPPPISYEALTYLNPIWHSLIVIRRFLLG